MADKFEIQNQYQHFGFEKKKLNLFRYSCDNTNVAIRFLNNTEYNIDDWLEDRCKFRPTYNRKSI